MTGGSTKGLFEHWTLNTPVKMD